MLAAFKADQLNALVTFFLELRKYGTFITQFFSFWVLLLGYLVFKSGFLPRILGILLMLAGLCYTVSAVLFFLFPNFDATILGLFAFIGESLFYLWLLIKGVNVEEWKKLAASLIAVGIKHNKQREILCKKKQIEKH